MKKKNLSHGDEIGFTMILNLHEYVCGRYIFGRKKAYAAALLSVEHVLKSNIFEQLLFGRGAVDCLSQPGSRHTFKNRATGAYPLRRIYIEASSSFS